MQRALRILMAASLAVLAASALAACGGDDANAGGAPCQEHSECNRGQFCSLEGVCAEQACQSAGDCSQGLVCLRDIGMCGEAECSDEAPCGAGFSCDRGTCVEDVVTTPDVVGGDDTSDPVDVKVDEDVQPEVVTPVDVAACTECAADEDCGVDKTCEQLGAMRACVGACTNDADCDGGWVCYPLTNELNACVPASFSCAATCLAEGCAAGQVCDQIDGSATFGQCVAAVAECGECQTDWQCGDDTRCSSGFCVPLCADGQCPTWANCQEKGGLGGEGVMVCKPKNLTCCGDGCTLQCDPACDGTTPVCHDAVCVQCVEDGDCTGTNETCDPGTFRCQGGLCSGNPSTPFELNGSCVQCLQDAHCASGQCDQATNTCVGGGDQCGGACVAPYPGCAVINGVPSCVPCTGDEHCTATGGTCNTTTYGCEGGTSDGGCLGDCVLNGCPNTSGQFTLECDPDTGCCYDTAGACDNVEAFCRTDTGSECKSILEIFGGGALPTIPGMEGGFVGGFCTCDSAFGFICGLTPDNPLCDNVPQCPEGVSCMPSKTALDLLLALTGGGGGAGAILSSDLCMSLGK